jgi:hypothetical protein
VSLSLRRARLRAAGLPSSHYRQARPSSAHPHVVLFLQHLLLSGGQLGHDDELHWQVPLVHTRLFVHA